MLLCIFAWERRRDIIPGISIKRFESVDLLRGLCIVAVVIHHINIRIRFNQSAWGAMLPNDLNTALFWTGSGAVKVFFVVSGFLITSNIVGRWGSLDRIDCRAFYRMRFARIAPCLLGLLFILSWIHLNSIPGFIINPQRATLARALAAGLTFHVNWLETRVGYLPANWDVLWSLSVEEAFYLIYPLLCQYLKPRYLLAIAGALIVAGPFFRSILAPNALGADYMYLANMDCIAIGCLAAIAALRFRPKTQMPGWILLAAVVLVRNRIFPKFIFDSGLDVTIFALSAALIVMGAGHGRLPYSWPLRWFGRNSYEVYLTHSFIVILGSQWFMLRHIPINYAPAWFAGSLILAGLLGYAVARWYSEPMNRRLREKPLLSRAVNV